MAFFQAHKTRQSRSWTKTKTIGFLLTFFCFDALAKKPAIFLIQNQKNISKKISIKNRLISWSTVKKFPQDLVSLFYFVYIKEVVIFAL